MKLQTISCSLLSALLFIGTVGCNESEPQPKTDFWTNYIPFVARYNDADLEMVQNFDSPASPIGTSSLREASGLAYSRTNPGYIWSHQDKNNDNKLFLLDAQTGETVATYAINGTSNRDWEDIEISTGPEAGKSYLYVGDTGDNDLEYGSYTIYRFLEPTFETAHRGQNIALDLQYDEIKFNYPERNHDVESLMVDPLTGDIYLATKRDLRAILFVLPFPQPVNNQFTATKAGTFAFSIATAGTVSKDGSEVLIKTYNRIYHWKKVGTQSFLELLASKPAIAPYNPIEEQGEAISFDPHGGYYTLSEWSNSVVPILYHYNRK